jgi:hypothetical protein
VKKTLKLMALATAVFMVCSFFLLDVAGSAILTKYTTHYYSCRVHTNCHHITFKSQGNTTTGQIYDKWFDSMDSHWPNAFRVDSTWSYTVGTTGYAKGTYTIYASIITQWASLAFKSTTRTITHTY